MDGWDPKTPIPQTKPAFWRVSRGLLACVQGPSGVCPGAFWRGSDLRSPGVLQCSNYTALHFILLCSTAPHCSLFYTPLSNALHCTSLYSNILHYIPLYSITLHCTPLYCTALHCTPLYCTALQVPAWCRCTRPWRTRVRAWFPGLRPNWPSACAEMASPAWHRRSGRTTGSRRGVGGGGCGNSVMAHGLAACLAGVA